MPLTLPGVTSGVEVIKIGKVGECCCVHRVDNFQEQTNNGGWWEGETRLTAGTDGEKKKRSEMRIQVTESETKQGQNATHPK